MDDTSTSILCQVALKEAGECARQMNMNLTVPEHQAAFEELYTYITDSLFTTVYARLAMTPQSAVSAVVHAFPGTQAVNQGYVPQAPAQQGYQPVQQMAQPVAGGYGVPQAPRVKGETSGAPFPDWALAAFAEKGTVEVYDNRHTLAANPKRPWFKDTKSGDGFWPPDR
jgi:hypothetical protein